MKKNEMHVFMLEDQLIVARSLTDARAFWLDYSGEKIPRSEFKLLPDDDKIDLLDAENISFNMTARELASRYSEPAVILEGDL